MSSGGQARGRRALDRPTPYARHTPAIQISTGHPSSPSSYEQGPQPRQSPKTPRTPPSTTGDHMSLEGPTWLTPSLSDQEQTPPHRSYRSTGSATDGGTQTPLHDASQLTRVSSRRANTSLMWVTSSPASRDVTNVVTGDDSLSADAPLYRLAVRPLVKETIAQREASCETLDDIFVKGASFKVILKQLLDQFSTRVKCRSVKSHGEWSVAVPDVTDWSKVMQLKLKKHVVDSTRNERAWNTWLHAIKDETAILLIYEYGVAVATKQDLDKFKRDCINPLVTDRSGATAEVSLRSIVGRLQERWGTTFQGSATVWRMWANHLTRDLNRSTGDASIDQPPPDHVARL